MTYAALARQVMEGKLGGGEAVILEYADSLSQHNADLFQGLSSHAASKKKDCCVM
jgi:hypothetical protein